MLKGVASSLGLFGCWDGMVRCPYGLFAAFAVGGSRVALYIAKICRECSCADVFKGKMTNCEVSVVAVRVCHEFCLG